MKRPLFGLMMLTGALLCAFGIAPSAFAASGTLDQEQLTFDSGGSYIGAALNQPMEQTFTAGRSGTLTDISIWAHLQGSTPPGNFVIQLKASDGTLLASGTVLGTTFLASPFTDRWNSVTFASPPAVVAGSQYKIGVTSTTNAGGGGSGGGGTAYYALPFSSSDPYLGGSLTGFGSWDLSFRTYVLDPAPPAAATTHAHAGYCSAAGNTWSDGTPIPTGTFLNLDDGQTESDPHYTGATPAFYYQGHGISCGKLAGYVQTSELVGYYGHGDAGGYVYMEKTP
jgi:hypothetical protein